MMQIRNSQKRAVPRAAALIKQSRLDRPARSSLRVPPYGALGARKKSRLIRAQIVG